MKTIRQTVNTALAADIPVILWGLPGAGKTALLTAMARDANAHLEVLIGSQLDPVDVGGQPVPDSAGNVQLSPPPWARRIQAALRGGRAAWLFADELSAAPPSVQAALLRVVHDREAGGLEMRGCRVVAASNPADTAADGGTLSAAMASRWCHVEFTVDATEWARGEASGWGAMPAPRHAAASALVAAFVQRNPSSLAPRPTQAEPRGWPCPRSWSAVARGIAAVPGAPDQAAQTDVGRMLAEGLVGPGAATEWITFASAMDLPNPEDLLAAPVKCRLPERADQLAATLLGLAAAATQPHDAVGARVCAAWRILGRVRPDQALLAGGVLVTAWPDVPPEAEALGRKILDLRDGLKT